MALRVRAKIWMGKAGEELREDMTEPPCLPVAPTTRYLLVAIVLRRYYIDVCKEGKFDYFV